MKSCSTTVSGLRMSCWLATSLVLVAIVSVLAPQQIPVMVNKLCLVSAAAYVGYWISRSAWPYARPGDLLALINHKAEDAPPTEWELMMGRLVASALIARAILISACMIAVALGI